jgi:ankyrin repeat protein
LGIDVNAQNRDGITPLISAVNGKQIKAAKFLLDAGSDTNFKGLHGMTALNEAVFYNCPQLVALLFEVIFSITGRCFLKIFNVSSQ